jgi:hypothetical protein
MTQRVKLLQSISRLWIIVPSENERLAWSGAQWVPIDRDGLPLSEARVMSFTSAAEAIVYGYRVGFDIEHG